LVDRLTAALESPRSWPPGVSTTVLRVLLLISMPFWRCRKKQKLGLCKKLVAKSPMIRHTVNQPVEREVRVQDRTIAIDSVEQVPPKMAFTELCVKQVTPEWIGILESRWIDRGFRKRRRDVHPQGIKQESRRAPPTGALVNIE
jgi:hypothetical protein